MTILREWPVRLIHALVLIWLALLLLNGSANAQAVRWDYVASTVGNGQPGKPPILALPGTIVNLCSGANSGLVSTSGKVVTWVSGTQFTISATGQISINGTSQQIQFVSSATSLTLVGSVGALTNVTYSTLSSCLASPATTYTYFDAVTPCPTTAQLTPQTGGACLSTADAEGNAGAWLLPGQYSFYLRLPAAAGSGIYGPYPINVGASAGCPLGATCDASFSTLSLACTAAGTGTLYITRLWSSLTTSSLAGCRLLFLGNGQIRPASGQTITIGNISGAVNLSLTSGGSFASALTTPQTFQSQWFTGATDYGARVKAASTIIHGGGGVIDAATGESGALATLAGTQDILSGCDGTIVCTVYFADNSGSGGTPISMKNVCGALTAVAGICVRSNTRILSGYFQQDNVANPNTSFSRMIEIAPDQSNVEIANLYLIGKPGQSAACDAGNGQQHGIITDGTRNLKIHHNRLDTMCADGIALQAGTAIKYNSGEIWSNTISFSRRDNITTNVVNGMDVHDNTLVDPGADQMHGEPNDAANPIANLHIHHNTSTGGCVHDSDINLGPHSTADVVSFGVQIDNENITCGRIISNVPSSILSNNHVKNSVGQPGMAIQTHDSQIIGGSVEWDTPLVAGSSAAVMMVCTPATVPNVGQGNNLITGVGIYNSSRLGILNQGCNNSRIQDNNIQGITSISGISFGIDLAPDGTNAATGVNVVVQGNTIQPTSSVTTFAFGIVDNAASGAGVNYILNNFIQSETSACISGVTCQRYKVNANVTDVIQDNVPITYARLPGIVFGSGGAPANGSTFFISDGQVTTVNGSGVVTAAQCKASGGGSLAVVLAPNAAGLKCNYLP